MFGSTFITQDVSDFQKNITQYYEITGFINEFFAINLNLEESIAIGYKNEFFSFEFMRFNIRYEIKKKKKQFKIEELMNPLKRKNKSKTPPPGRDIRHHENIIKMNKTNYYMN